MHKTPDDVKKGLECCNNIYSCPDCPYDNGDESWGCTVEKNADALALIQQKEQENAEQAERIRQLEAERDAAVETIYEMEKCITDACEWCDGVECERLCMMHLTERPGFKWRGVTKEE